MKIAVFLVSFCAGLALAQDDLRLDVEVLAPLPRSVANNAVAAVTIDSRHYVVSFNGIGAGLTHADAGSDTYVYDANNGQWSHAGRVPGDVGRLASIAVGVGKLVYVFGGYSVAADGAEVSVNTVHSFSPVNQRFERLAPMPVPVDDAVAVAFVDRYIYLISGWHDSGNVNLVQRYDTDTDSWDQATPLPAASVFGHAGGIVGNRIAYCDGVLVRPHLDRPRDFAASNECLVGTIDASDGRRIEWRKLPAHPGSARYRMAAAGLPERNAVIFVGGSDNPYNYNGIGYDGQPSNPLADALYLQLDTLEWRVIETNSQPTMDHRGLVVIDGGFATVGGIGADQRVLDRFQKYTLRE